MNQLTLGNFAPPLDQSLSQYHTPVKLARKIIKWAQIKPVTKAIEPSAGGGNILRELINAKANTLAVEIDDRWVSVLEREFTTAKIINGDFLKIDPTDEYDIAVMNPPLDGGVGAVHVEHALRFAPRVISILRSNDLHCKERFAKLWSRCVIAKLALLVERPVYSGKGGQIETIVVDVRRNETYLRKQTIEHWADSWP